MHSATCSIWSREMKLRVCGENGAPHAIVVPVFVVSWETT